MSSTYLLFLIIGLSTQSELLCDVWLPRASYFQFFQEKWDYLSNKDWSGYDQLKSGQLQSPINIQTNKTIMETLGASVYEFDKIQKHSESLRFAKVSTFDFSGNDARFQTQYLEAHSPSEHQIDGYHFDLEIQLFSQAEAQFCRQIQNKLTAFSILFEIDEEAPSFYFQTRNESIPSLIQYILYQMDQDINIIQYQGSLNRAPYVQQVNWLVTLNPIKIKSKDIEKLAFNLRHHAKPNRQIQPSNDRIIKIGVLKFMSNVARKLVSKPSYYTIDPAKPSCVLNLPKSAFPGDWNYTNPNWTIAYCGGKAQTPVNIVTSNVVTRLQNNRNLFTAVEWLNNSIVEKGAVQQVIEVGGETTHAVTYDQSDLKILYRGAGFHIHVPSEHIVDGKSYVAEIHFVHVADKTYCSSVTNLITVVGIFFNITNETNVTDTFVRSMVNAADAAELDFSLKTNLLYQFGDTVTAYYYTGSLTTPSCAETVNWRVITQPISITQATLNLMKAKFSDVTIFGSKKSDNRPIQPLNGRQIHLGQVGFYAANEYFSSERPVKGLSYVATNQQDYTTYGYILMISILYIFI